MVCTVILSRTDSYIYNGMFQVDRTGLYKNKKTNRR